MRKWKTSHGTIVWMNCRKANVDFAISHGWVTVADHDDAMSEMDDKVKIAEYVLGKTGQIVDKRGSIEKVRKKAREILNGNSQ